MTYDLLITRLCGLLMQNITITYANAFLNQHLKTPELLDKLPLYNYLLVPEYNEVGKGVVLSGDSVIGIINDLSQFKNLTFSETADWMLEQNAVCARCWVINNAYEGLMNYIGIDSARREKRLNILRDEMWFKVLTVIRNNVSHFDNCGKPVSWKFPEDVLQWGTIELKRGEPADKLRYNDGEIIGLLQFMIQYLRDHREALE